MSFSPNSRRLFLTSFKNASNRKEFDAWFKNSAVDGLKEIYSGTKGKPEDSLSAMRDNYDFLCINLYRKYNIEPQDLADKLDSLWISASKVSAKRFPPLSGLKALFLFGPSGLGIERPFHIWILHSRALWKSYLRLTLTLAKTVSKQALSDG